MKELDKKTIVKQIMEVLLLPQKETFREISTGFPDPVSIKGFIFWEYAAQTLMEILSIDHYGCEGNSVPHRMAELARRHAKKRELPAPILFSEPLSLGGCREIWMVRLTSNR